MTSPLIAFKDGHNIAGALSQSPSSGTYDYSSGASSEIYYSCPSQGELENSHPGTAGSSDRGNDDSSVLLRNGSENRDGNKDDDCLNWNIAGSQKRRKLKKTQRKRLKRRQKRRQTKQGIQKSDQKSQKGGGSEQCHPAEDATTGESSSYVSCISEMEAHPLNDVAGYTDLETETIKPHESTALPDAEIIVERQISERTWNLAEPLITPEAIGATSGRMSAVDEMPSALAQDSRSNACCCFFESSLEENHSSQTILSYDRNNIPDTENDSLNLLVKSTIEAAPVEETIAETSNHGVCENYRVESQNATAEKVHCDTVIVTHSHLNHDKQESLTIDRESCSDGPEAHFPTKTDQNSTKQPTDITPGSQPKSDFNDGGVGCVEFVYQNGLGAARHNECTQELTKSVLLFTSAQDSLPSVAKSARSFESIAITEMAKGREVGIELAAPSTTPEGAAAPEPILGDEVESVETTENQSALLSADKKDKKSICSCENQEGVAPGNEACQLEMNEAENVSNGKPEILGSISSTQTELPWSDFDENRGETTDICASNHPQTHDLSENPYANESEEDSLRLNLPNENLKVDVKREDDIPGICDRSIVSMADAQVLGFTTDSHGSQGRTLRDSVAVLPPAAEESTTCDCLSTQLIRKNSQSTQSSLEDYLFCAVLDSILLDKTMRDPEFEPESSLINTPNGSEAKEKLLSYYREEKRSMSSPSLPGLTPSNENEKSHSEINCMSEQQPNNFSGADRSHDNPCATKREGSTKKRLESRENHQTLLKRDVSETEASACSLALGDDQADDGCVRTSLVDDNIEEVENVTNRSKSLSRTVSTEEDETNRENQMSHKTSHDEQPHKSFDTLYLLDSSFLPDKNQKVQSSSANLGKSDQGLEEIKETEIGKLISIGSSHHSLKNLSKSKRQGNVETSPPESISGDKLNASQDELGHNLDQCSGAYDYLEVYDSPGYSLLGDNDNHGHENGQAGDISDGDHRDVDQRQEVNGCMCRDSAPTGLLQHPLVDNPELEEGGSLSQSPSGTVLEKYEPEGVVGESGMDQDLAQPHDHSDMPGFVESSFVEGQNNQHDGCEELTPGKLKSLNEESEEVTGDKDMKLTSTRLPEQFLGNLSVFEEVTHPEKPSDPKLKDEPRATQESEMAQKLSKPAEVGDIGNSNASDLDSFSLESAEYEVYAKESTPNDVIQVAAKANEISRNEKGAATFTGLSHPCSGNVPRLEKGPEFLAGSSRSVLSNGHASIAEQDNERRYEPANSQSTHDCSETLKLGFACDANQDHQSGKYHEKSVSGNLREGPSEVIEAESQNSVHTRCDDGLDRVSWSSENEVSRSASVTGSILRDEIGVSREKRMSQELDQPPEICDYFISNVTGFNSSSLRNVADEGDALPREIFPNDTMNAATEANFEVGDEKKDATFTELSGNFLEGAEPEKGPNLSTSSSKSGSEDAPYHAAVHTSQMHHDSVRSQIADDRSKMTCHSFQAPENQNQQGEEYHAKSFSNTLVKGFGEILEGKSRAPTPRKMCVHSPENVSESVKEAPLPASPSGDKPAASQNEEMDRLDQSPGICDYLDSNTSGLDPSPLRVEDDNSGDHLNTSDTVDATTEVNEVTEGENQEMTPEELSSSPLENNSRKRSCGRHESELEDDWETITSTSVRSNRDADNQTQHADEHIPKKAFTPGSVGQESEKFSINDRWPVENDEEPRQAQSHENSHISVSELSDETCGFQRFGDEMQTEAGGTDPNLQRKTQGTKEQESPDILPLVAPETEVVHTSASEHLYNFVEKLDCEKTGWTTSSTNSSLCRQPHDKAGEEHGDSSDEPQLRINCPESPVENICAGEKKQSLLPVEKNGFAESQKIQDEENEPLQKQSKSMSSNMQEYFVWGTSNSELDQNEHEADTTAASTAEQRPEVLERQNEQEMTASDKSESIQSLQSVCSSEALLESVAELDPLRPEEAYPAQSSNNLGANDSQGVNPAESLLCSNEPMFSTTAKRHSCSESSSKSRSASEMNSVGTYPSPGSPSEPRYDEKTKFSEQWTCDQAPTQNSIANFRDDCIATVTDAITDDTEELAAKYSRDRQQSMDMIQDEDKNIKLHSQGSRSNEEMQKMLDPCHVEVTGSDEVPVIESSQALPPEENALTCLFGEPVNDVSGSFRIEAERNCNSDVAKNTDNNSETKTSENGGDICLSNNNIGNSAHGDFILSSHEKVAPSNDESCLATEQGSQRNEDLSIAPVSPVDVERGKVNHESDEGSCGDHKSEPDNDDSQVPQAPEEGNEATTDPLEGRASSDLEFRISDVHPFDHSKEKCDESHIDGVLEIEETRHEPKTPPADRGPAEKDEATTENEKIYVYGCAVVSGGDNPHVHRTAENMIATTQCQSPHGGSPSLSHSVHMTESQTERISETSEGKVEKNHMDDEPSNEANRSPRELTVLPESHSVLDCSTEEVVDTEDNIVPCIDDPTGQEVIQASEAAKNDKTMETSSVENYAIICPSNGESRLGGDAGDADPVDKSLEKDARESDKDGHSDIGKACHTSPESPIESVGGTSSYFNKKVTEAQSDLSHRAVVRTENDETESLTNISPSRAVLGDIHNFCDDLVDKPLSQEADCCLVTQNDLRDAHKENRKPSDSISRKASRSIVENDEPYPRENEDIHSFRSTNECPNGEDTNEMLDEHDESKTAFSDERGDHHDEDLHATLQESPASKTIPEKDDSVRQYEWDTEVLTSGKVDESKRIGEKVDSTISLLKGEASAENSEVPQEGIEGKLDSEQCHDIRKIKVTNFGPSSLELIPPLCEEPRIVAESQLSRSRPLVHFDVFPKFKRGFSTKTQKRQLRNAFPEELRAGQATGSRSAENSKAAVSGLKLLGEFLSQRDSHYLGRLEDTAAFGSSQAHKELFSAVAGVVSDKHAKSIRHYSTRNGRDNETDLKEDSSLNDGHRTKKIDASCMNEQDSRCQRQGTDGFFEKSPLLRVDLPPPRFNGLPQAAPVDPVSCRNASFKDPPQITTNPSFPGDVLIEKDSSNKTSTRRQSTDPKQQETLFQPQAENRSIPCSQSRKDHLQAHFAPPTRHRHRQIESQEGTTAGSSSLQFSRPVSYNSRKLRSTTKPLEEAKHCRVDKEGQISVNSSPISIQPATKPNGSYRLKSSTKDEPNNHHLSKSYIRKRDTYSNYEEMQAPYWGPSGDYGAYYGGMPRPYRAPSYSAPDWGYWASAPPEESSYAGYLRGYMNGYQGYPGYQGYQYPPMLRRRESSPPSSMPSGQSFRRRPDSVREPEMTYPPRFEEGPYTPTYYPRPPPENPNRYPARNPPPMPPPCSNPSYHDNRSPDYDPYYEDEDYGGRRSAMPVRGRSPTGNPYYPPASRRPSVEFEPGHDFYAEPPRREPVHSRPPRERPVDYPPEPYGPNGRRYPYYAHDDFDEYAPRTKPKKKEQDRPSSQAGTFISNMINKLRQPVEIDVNPGTLMRRASKRLSRKGSRHRLHRTASTGTRGSSFSERRPSSHIGAETDDEPHENGSERESVVSPSVMEAERRVKQRLAREREEKEDLEREAREHAAQRERRKEEARASRLRDERHQSPPTSPAPKPHRRGEDIIDNEIRPIHAQRVPSLERIRRDASGPQGSDRTSSWVEEQIATPPEAPPIVPTITDLPEPDISRPTTGEGSKRESRRLPTPPTRYRDSQYDDASDDDIDEILAERRRQKARASKYPGNDYDYNHDRYDNGAQYRAPPRRPRTTRGRDANDDDDRRSKRGSRIFGKVIDFFGKPAS